VTVQFGNLGIHAATMTMLGWWCGQEHKTHDKNQWSTKQTAWM